MIFKLLGGVAAAFLGYEGYQYYRKKTQTWSLVPGHGYVVTLDYNGAGAGGPLGGSDLQSALDQGPAGIGNIRVFTTQTDPGLKTITYLCGVIAPQTVGQAALAPDTLPTAYGNVSVAGVQDTGNVPMGIMAGASGGIR